MLVWLSSNLPVSEHVVISMMTAHAIHMQARYDEPYPWLSAKLQYLHHTGDTAVLHWAINMFVDALMPYKHQGPFYITVKSLI